MKIYILIFITFFGINYTCFVSGGVHTKGVVTVKEAEGPGGVWKTNVVWKSYWAKEWITKKIYVPIWKKVWGPVEVRQWIPVIKPTSGWNKH